MRRKKVLLVDSQLRNMMRLMADYVVPLTERGLQTAVFTNEYSITIELSYYTNEIITLSMTINRLEEEKMAYVVELFEKLCCKNVYNTIIEAKKYYKQKYKF